jgi:hypothetical protein
MTSDKLLHITASAGLVALLSLQIGTIPAFVLVLTVGALKEVFWDGLLHKGDPGALDFLADLVGALCGAALATMVRAFLND